MTGFSWMWQVYSLEFRKLLFYRLNFWIQFLVPTIGQLMISFFLWGAVFESQDAKTIGGYSFPAMLVYSILVTLVDRTVVGAGWRQGAAGDIYEGALSRYLVYPISFFSYKLVSHLANASFSTLQLVLTLSVFFLIFGKPEDLTLSLQTYALGFLMMFFSTLLCFSINVFVDLVAFWADNVWSLQVMTRLLTNFLGGALFPISFFPEKVADFLHFLPFHLIISAPVRAFMGKTTPVECAQSMGAALLWIAIMCFLIKRTYARGLKIYSGVGM